MRAYHLLWELTHICLEQPAVLRSTDSTAAFSCQTCSDDLTMGEVVVSTGTQARVRTAEGVVRVDTSLVGAVAVNDLLLTQAGVALRCLAGVKHE